MPHTLAAMLPYIPPGLARALLTDPTLAPLEEQFPAAVLFADISGFTPLTETLAQRGAEGPEEMTRLLNAYLRVCPTFYTWRFCQGCVARSATRAL
jgi:class 3 adenylate cyclase